MRTETFDNYVAELIAGGRNDKKRVIREIVANHDESKWVPALVFLSGRMAEDSGVGKKTAQTAVVRSNMAVDAETFEEYVEDEGTVTEALRNCVEQREATLFGNDLNVEMEALYHDLTSVCDASGDRQIERLADVISSYEQPHVATFAVLDDWQTGVTETTIANALGEQVDATTDQIQRARALEPDAVQFAKHVERGAFEEMLEPTPGKPFKPQKAKSESHLDDLLARDTPIVAEPKLDGYRLLVHVQDGDVTAYTRRLKDATASLPELQQIDWPDDSDLILDGEVLASDGSYSTTSEMVGSTQERDLDDRDEHVVFHAFDILYDSNVQEMGLNQSRRRYEKRRTGLVLVSEQIQSRYFEIVPAFGFAEDDDPVPDALDYAEENGLEGIIVKDGAAEYDFGKRSKSWVKKKLSEETVDLVMAEFEQGEGNNAGVLGGVRLETADGVYVGNVGTGFTDEQRNEIWSHPDEYRGETIEVTAEGLGTNRELRFPRVERLRIDDGEPDTFDRLTEILDDV